MSVTLVCLLLVCLLFVVWSHGVEAEKPRTVALILDDQGTQLIGVRVSDNVSMFTGIPFATAPLEQARFQPAPLYTLFEFVTHQSHSERSDEPVIIDATTPKPTCVQFPASSTSIIGDEDCLYLTIWMPLTLVEQMNEHRRTAQLLRRQTAEGTAAAQDVVQRSAPSFPVYFYIYGGGFNTEYFENAAEWLEHSPTLVVVEPQYRLGIFGFLSWSWLDNEQKGHSGNYGLMDQTVALTWVHYYISVFGGDSARVTIGGQSAGSMSVCYHLVSPLSRDLFSAAIMESGACDNDIRDRSEANDIANAFAKHAGCSSNQQLLQEGNDYQIGSPLDCLRSLPASNIASLVSTFIYSPLYVGEQFRPVVDDGLFVANKPLSSFQKQSFARVPLLVGSAMAEVNMSLLLDPSWSQVTWSTFSDYFPRLINENVSLSTAALQQYYSQQNDLWDGQAVHALIDAASTFKFQCPNYRTANYLSSSNNGAVYLYSFNYISPRATIVYPFGAIHGSELPYVFHQTNDTFFLDGRMNSDEESLSRTMMQWWLRFVVSPTHDPNDNTTVNIDGARQDVEWPRYTSSEDAYIEISPTADVEANSGDYHTKPCQLWAQLY